MDIEDIESSLGQIPTLQDQRPLYLPQDSRRLNLEGQAIIFGDAHWWPDVPSPATDILVQIAEHIKPVCFVANGDLMDNATNSRHSRIGWDKRPPLSDELTEVQRQMDRIAQASPEAIKLWTWGNHCIRFNTYLATNAGLYEQIHGHRLEDHFPKWDFVWSCVINNETVIKHRYKGGKHSAYNNAVSAGVNMVTGHTHRLTVRAITDFRGTRYGVEHGTLCNPLSPCMDYAEHNPLDMQEGFIVMTIDEMGTHFEPVEVINGKARWAGKIWVS